MNFKLIKQDHSNSYQKVRYEGFAGILCFARKSPFLMNFDYHAVAALLHTAIPLAAGAAGVGYYVLRQRGVGFTGAHLLVGVPMTIIGGAAAFLFYATK